jgi:hypothetical protein
MLLALGSTAVIFIGILLIISNRDAIQSINNLRDENRVVSCVRENVHIATLHAKLPEALLAFVPPGAELTPEQQAILDRYTLSVEDGFPFRDCSEAGIEAYYENPPVDPAATSD